MAYVIDSSALVKLIVNEQHSKSLSSWIDGCKQDLFISELARTEVSRAIARVDPNLNKQFNAIVTRFGVIRVSTQVLTIAAFLLVIHSAMVYLVFVKSAEAIYF